MILRESRISGKDVVRVFSKIGFQVERKRGSHIIMSRGVCNVTTTLHKKTGNIATSDNDRNTTYSTKEEECTEICTENRETSRTLHESYSNPGEGALSDGYVCDPKNIVNRSKNSMQERQIDNSNREMRPNTLQTGL